MLLCTCACDAQARLEAARKESLEELQLWEKEIKEKSAAAKQKQGFDAFLQAQVPVAVRIRCVKLVDVALTLKDCILCTSLFIDNLTILLEQQ